MNVILEWTCQIGLGKKLLRGKKFLCKFLYCFCLTKIFKQIWTSKQRQFPSQKPKWSESPLSIFQQCWAPNQNMLQPLWTTPSCLHSRPPPEKRIWINANKSIFLLQLSQAFILFVKKKKKSSSKTWHVKGFKISKCTEHRERNIQDIKICGLEACG